MTHETIFTQWQTGGRCCSWTEWNSFLSADSRIYSLCSSKVKYMSRIQFNDLNIDIISPTKWTTGWQLVNIYLIQDIYPSSQRLYVHPFHFPLSLLNLRKDNPKIGMSTPLLSTTAVIIRTNDFGHNMFNWYTNYLSCIISYLW